MEQGPCSPYVLITDVVKIYKYTFRRYQPSLTQTNVMDSRSPSTVSTHTPGRSLLASIDGKSDNNGFMKSDSNAVVKIKDSTTAIL